MLGLFEGDSSGSDVGCEMINVKREGVELYCVSLVSFLNLPKCELFHIVIIVQALPLVIHLAHKKENPSQLCLYYVILSPL